MSRSFQTTHFKVAVIISTDEELEGHKIGQLAHSHTWEVTKLEIKRRFVLTPNIWEQR